MEERQNGVVAEDKNTRLVILSSSTSKRIAYLRNLRERLRETGNNQRMYNMWQI